MSQIIFLSLYVSVVSTLIASILGILLGIPFAMKNTPVKQLVIKITNSLMSTPPVLIGLVVYLVLSRRGPLGALELLFTPEAMIIAQTLLIFPLIFGLVISSVDKNILKIRKTCLALNANESDILKIVLRENKLQLITAVTVGFGRAISEVGAAMLVGGNIKGFTRIMTTYIALETGKGEFQNAIFIGIVLLIISFAVNSFLHLLKRCE
ncbi:ABC transporter permease [Bacillota bacterium LX-D]|nr:ABC transporter permease [Bacillota bacterium LX-D]